MNENKQTVLTDPLHAAIDLLTQSADALRDCHTISTPPDDWTGEPEAKAEYDRILQVVDALSKLRAAGEPYIDIVFDGPAGPEGGRFVEVEAASGQSISVGTWIVRADGYHALRIPAAPQASAEAQAAQPAASAPVVPLEVVAMLNAATGSNEWQGDYPRAGLTEPACRAIAALAAHKPDGGDAKDAERYRWLRDAHPADQEGLWVAHGLPGRGLDCWRNEELDAAIDAAISAQQRQEGK